MKSQCCIINGNELCRSREGRREGEEPELLPSMARPTLPDLNCCFIRFANFSLYIVAPANPLPPLSHSLAPRCVRVTRREAD